MTPAGRRFVRFQNEGFERGERMVELTGIEPATS